MDTSKDIDTHCQRRELDRALELATAWTVALPNDMKTWAKLAYVYDLQGNTVAALDAIERAMAVAEQPQPALYFKQARYLFTVSDFERSAQAFEKCRDFGEDGYYTHAANLGLAKTYSLMSNYDAASQILQAVDDGARMWLGGLVEASALRCEVEQRRIYTRSMAADPCSIFQATL